MHYFNFDPVPQVLPHMWSLQCWINELEQGIGDGSLGVMVGLMNSGPKLLIYMSGEQLGNDLVIWFLGSSLDTYMYLYRYIYIYI